MKKVYFFRPADLPSLFFFEGLLPEDILFFFFSPDAVSAADRLLVVEDLEPSAWGREGLI
jgi:hypothetical protein